MKSTSHHAPQAPYKYLQMSCSGYSSEDYTQIFMRGSRAAIPQSVHGRMLLRTTKWRDALVHNAD
jgi:hypothetical protein